MYFPSIRTHATIGPECNLESLKSRLIGGFVSYEESILSINDDQDSPPGLDELRKSCHADAFTTYATFYKACYLESAGYYFYENHNYFADDSVQPERLYQVWQGYLEHRWIDEKCKSFDNDVRLTIESAPDLFELLQAMDLAEKSPDELRELERMREEQPDFYQIFEGAAIYQALLLLGVKFGDDAASLTSRGLATPPGSWGVYSHLFSGSRWLELRRQKELSAKRLRLTLDLIIDLEEAGIEFNWEWLVSHICSPEQPDRTESSEPTQTPSCRSLINYWYTNPSLLGNSELPILEKFERVAIQLDVYD